MECEKYNKKYIHMLENPEYICTGIPNGLKTIKAKIKQTKKIELNSIKNFYFGFIFDYVDISNNSANSNYFDIINSSYDPYANYTGAITFKASNFDTITNYLITNDSLYYVTSGKIKITVLQKLTSGNYGEISSYIHGCVLKQNKINTANLIYINNFKQSNKYLFSTNNYMEYFYVPNEFPIKIRRANTNPQVDNTDIKQIFGFIYQDATITSTSAESIVQIDIEQNIEIITNNQPFYHTLNCCTNFSEITNDINKTEISQMPIKNKISKYDRYEDCDDCKYKKKQNMFLGNNNIYRLPNDNEFVDSIIITKTKTFKLSTNNKGNFCYLFNPYILYFQNNRTINNHNIKLEWLVNDNSFNWQNTNYTLADTTNLNALTLANENSSNFINDTYLNKARLIKGSIKAFNYQDLKKTSGDIIFGVADYKLNFQGTSPYTYTNPQNDVSFGFLNLNNLKEKKYVKEFPIENKNEYIIYPEYWDRCKYYNFEPKVTEHPIGVNTNCVFVGVHSAFPSSEIMLDIELFYEVELNEYPSTSKFTSFVLDYNHLKTLNHEDLELMIKERDEMEDKNFNINTCYKQFKKNKSHYFK